LKNCLRKNLQKICCIILICYIVNISVYPLYSPEHQVKSSPAPLMLIAYGTHMEFVIPSLGLNRIIVNKLLPIKIRSFMPMDSTVYFPFESYSDQRKNQVVLDKRKYIFKLFPHYFQGNDLKWRNHLFQI